MVVIPGNLRVQAAKPHPLEQMTLPQITDVVINAATFIPARHRPDVAGQHHKAYEAAGNLQITHRVIPARAIQNRCRQVRMGARPSSTSDIRSRAPSVVSAGSAPASKNPQAIISWFGSGKRSCL